MAEKPFNYRLLARIVAIIFALVFSATFAFGIAFGTRPFPLIDQIVGGLSVLYIIGLLLGLKSPLLGVVLSSILPIFEIIHVFSFGVSVSGVVGALMTMAVLLIPASLYYLSWHFHTRPDKAT